MQEPTYQMRRNTAGVPELRHKRPDLSIPYDDAFGPKRNRRRIYSYQRR